MMSRAFVVLCLLGAVVATASATAGGLFAQRKAASLSDEAKAKIESYGRADVKRMCLRESAQHNCRYVGCPYIQGCKHQQDNTATPICGNCQTHLIGQSDVMCCDHKDYDYEPSTPSLADSVTTPVLKVGTCDWDMDLYKCGADSTQQNTDDTGNVWEDCYEAIAMDNGAYKVGTVWGTCYLNADSESCGHPFCDKMVLSFQGGAYMMHAYTKGAPVEPTYDDPTYGGCFFLNSTLVLGDGFRKASSRKSSPLKRMLAKTHLLDPEVATTSSSSRLEAGPASTQYGYGGYGEQGENPEGITWYSGVALMFSGPVTLISMDRNVEYSHGMLEYVPSWFPQGVSANAPGATALVVNPYQYDIILSKDKEGYGYGGRFDGGRGESYYKEGY